MRHCAACLVLFLLSIAQESGAQIINGDFRNGSEGWVAKHGDGSAGSHGVRFPDPGVDGVVVFGFEGVTGYSSSIEQEFDCSEPSGCLLSVDYRETHASYLHASAYFAIVVDGVTRFSKAARPRFVLNWETHETPVAAGHHVLRLVVNTYPAAVAQIDNVRLRAAPVPVEAVSWGGIKGRWRDSK